VPFSNAGQVAVDPGAGSGKLVVCDGQFGAPPVLPRRVASLRYGDRVGDQLVLVAAEAGQRVDNCLLDSVSVQPASGQPPGGLGADVGGQPDVLGFDGVGLVLVVGGPGT
jgi:hypothetical protein